jgi:hypothetical protein
MPKSAGAMPGAVNCRHMLALAPQGVEVHGLLLEDEARATSRPSRAARADG